MPHLVRIFLTLLFNSSCCHDNQFPTGITWQYLASAVPLTSHFLLWGFTAAAKNCTCGTAQPFWCELRNESVRESPTGLTGGRWWWASAPSSISQQDGSEVYTVPQRVPARWSPSGQSDRLKNVCMYWFLPLPCFTLPSSLLFPEITSPKRPLA